jgi:hypothetical protein
MKVKYVLKKWDGSHAKVPKMIFDFFNDKKIADNTVLKWEARNGAIFSIRKSAVAEAFEIHPERFKALPEPSGRTLSGDERRKMVEEMRKKIYKNF